MKIAVVLGTSNSDGNTRYLVDEFINKSGAILFDLSSYDISFFDYEHKNKGDDFISLINELSGFNHIVFASPVYWYSMSAQLKVFFDRLSDLLSIEKDLGRQLKGKSISVLSTGFNLQLPTCFSQPFELTADYMKLVYKGCYYVSIQSQKNVEEIQNTVVQAIDVIT